MALLDSSNRLTTAAHFMRLITTPTMTKLDVRAAINAADDWADANAASYNTSLPLPFRTTATLAEKTAVLAYVILRRAGLLKAEGE